MLLIPCPWCGPRDEHEFSYGGEAHITRPEHPEELDDAAWADYLFMRTNTKGMHHERWMHAHGCRRWFNMARDTVTHEIAAVYPMGEKPPRAGAAPRSGAPRKKAPARKKAAATRTRKPASRRRATKREDDAGTTGSGDGGEQ